MADRERKKAGLTLKECGEELAKAIRRPQPYSHVTVFRFYNGTPTAEMADAFCALFGIPRWCYYPQDELEAMAFESIRKMSNARRKRAKVKPLLRAVDQAAGIPVASADETTEAAGGRRGGRDLPEGDRRVASSRSRSRARRP